MINVMLAAKMLWQMLDGDVQAKLRCRNGEHALA